MIFSIESVEHMKFVVNALNKDELKQIIKQESEIKVFKETGRVAHALYLRTKDFLKVTIKVDVISIPANDYDQSHHGWLVFQEMIKSRLNENNF